MKKKHKKPVFWTIFFFSKNPVFYFKKKSFFCFASLVADNPDLSVDLTRSMATLRSPDLFYIICGNGDFSQAVGNTSFPLWNLAMTSAPALSPIAPLVTTNHCMDRRWCPKVIPCYTLSWMETRVALFLEDNFQRGPGCTRVSYVILICLYVSIVRPFQLNRKLAQFCLSDMNSKLTNNNFIIC